MRKIDTQNSIVTQTHKTVFDDGEHEVTTIFDYSNCSDQQLLELATRTMTIAWRPSKRKMKSEQCNNEVVDVAEWLNNRNVGKSKVEKAKGLLAQLSEAEKAEIIKQMS